MVPMQMLPGKDKPFFPLNLVGDFAGGGLMCVVGILLALIERGRTGRGQVVDVDMVTNRSSNDNQCLPWFQVSGTRFLSSFPLILTQLRLPIFHGPRGTNILDGGAPFYNTYTCQDGRWMSVGCLEPQFFKIFIETFVDVLPQDFNPCGGWKPDFTTQLKREEWPNLEVYITKGFLTQPRDFWARLFFGMWPFIRQASDGVHRNLCQTGTDACAVPVLSPDEASKETTVVPLPHPQLSNSAKMRHGIGAENLLINPGTHTGEILHDLGIDNERVQELKKEGVFGKGCRHFSKL